MKNSQLFIKGIKESQARPSGCAWLHAACAAEWEGKEEGAARKTAKGSCSKCKKHFRAIFRGRHSSYICQAAHVISHSMFDPALGVWEGAGEGAGGGKKSGSAARNGNLAFMERNKYFKHVNSRVLSKEGRGGKKKGGKAGW